MVDAKILKYKKTAELAVQELQKLKKEKEEENKKLQETFKNTKALIEDLAKQNQELKSQLKRIDGNIPQDVKYIYEWYAENKKAILSKGHLKLVKIAIVLMIINIILVISIF